jgi:Ca2+/Na+ antiporter
LFVAPVLIAAAACLVGLLTSGFVSVISFIVLAIVLLYLVYVLFAVRVMKGLVHTIDKGRRDIHRDEQQVQLRVITAEEEPEFLTPLFDALNQRLTAIGYCDEIAGHIGQFSYYVYGQDQDQLVQECRVVAAEFPLPQGAYNWKPVGDQSDEGQRIEL